MNVESGRIFRNMSTFAEIIAIFAVLHAVLAGNLHEAIKEGNIAFLRDLLAEMSAADRGNNPITKAGTDENGETCLTLAIDQWVINRNNSEKKLRIAREILRLLLEYGGGGRDIMEYENKNNEIHRPLKRAIMYNYFEAIVELIEAGAEIDVADFEGKEPSFVHYAIRKRLPFHMLQYILSKNPNGLNMGDSSGYTPLKLLLKMGPECRRDGTGMDLHMKYIRLLLSKRPEDIQLLDDYPDLRAKIYDI